MYQEHYWAELPFQFDDEQLSTNVIQVNDDEVLTDEKRKEIAAMFTKVCWPKHCFLRLKFIMTIRFFRKNHRWWVLL